MPCSGTALPDRDGHTRPELFMTDLWHRGPRCPECRSGQRARGGVRAVACDGGSPTSVATSLRRLKRCVSLAVAVADIAGLWPLDRVTGELSTFASGCLDSPTESILLQLARRSARHRHRSAGGRIHRARHGKARGRRAQLLESDIDLILLYDRDAPALAGNEQISRHFVRAARMLVQLMSETSADGYIFRTDLRLRPDPARRHSPCRYRLPSFTTRASARTGNGRPAIKAHPVAGNPAVGEAFLASLQTHLAPASRLRGDPRHPLDQAPDRCPPRRRCRQGAGSQRQAGSWRHPRDRVLRPDPATDLRRPQSGTAPARDLPKPACPCRCRPRDSGGGEDLIEAYGFLRRVEHRLQMVGDQQTHSLPADEAGPAAIATFLVMATSGSFHDDPFARLPASRGGHYARLFEEAPSLPDQAATWCSPGADDDPGTLRPLRHARLSRSLRRSGHRPSLASRALPRDGNGAGPRTPTEIDASLLKAWPDGRTRPGLAQFRPLHRQPTGRRAALLAVQVEPRPARPGGRHHGSAPGLAAHLARRTPLLDRCCRRRSTVPHRHRTWLADLTRSPAELDHEQDILDQARRWANDRRFQIGVQQLRPSCGRVRQAWPHADIAAATISARFAIGPSTASLKSMADFAASAWPCWAW